MSAAFAFICRREGTRAMPRTRWEHVLSLELNWMTPGQAREYVARACAAGVLVEDGDAWRYHADPNRVEIPRGYRPNPAEEFVVETAAPDGFIGWVDAAAKATGATRDAILEKVRAKQEALGGMLSAEVAALWVAKEAGLEVKEALEQAGQT